MIAEVANHLWQSTVFTAAVGLLALAFRKNRAQVRYWLWLSASIKFLVPFSLLMGLGYDLLGRLAAGKIATMTAAPALSGTIVRITQPFPDTLTLAPAAQHATHWIPMVILGAWACGFLAVALMRFRRWLRVRAALRASTAMDIPAPVAVRSCPGLLEPGVIGFLRPIVLLPEGIIETLTRPQMEAVLAHELSHARRRDNLTAAIHMMVEALFWFYPLVWWIGARLIEERERACDESVLTLGSEPREYADAILNVCKHYVKSPVVCVSGIIGADLKRRIVHIMDRHIGQGLTPGRKWLLGGAAAAAIVLPLALGMTGASRAATQGAETGNARWPSFETTSIKLDKSHENCTVTRPPAPPFAPPAPYPAKPPSRGMFWFGTEKLWTMLPVDGTWRGLKHYSASTPGFRQKIFWWRKGYNWLSDPNPDLTVKGERLDGPAPHFLIPRATNGYEQNLKSFMLVGADIPTHGCWKITGRYKDDELSFVIRVVP